VSVHGDAGGDFKFFAIDGGQDSDIVVASSGGGDEAVVLIDHFYEVSDYQGHGLDAFEFFFGAQFLSG
jgi:hypothetical protein